MATKICPWCHGTVRGDRRVSLEVSFANHEASCPMQMKVKPKARSFSGEDAGPSSQRQGFESPTGRRVRHVYL